MPTSIINPLYYINKLVDLGRFILYPTPNSSGTTPAPGKFTTTIFLVFITLLFSVPSHFVIHNILHPRVHLSFLELPSKWGPAGFFFFCVILVPFVEETYYRLPLKFSPIFISISSGIFFHRIISKLFFHTGVYNFETYVFTRIAFALAGAVIVYFIADRAAIKMFLINFWANHFRLIFYIICFSFAWMHITNYNSSSYNLLLMPVITLPQFFLGLTTGFVRVKYGFLYSFLLHAVYNSSLYWLPYFNN